MVHFLLCFQWMSKPFILEAPTQQLCLLSHLHLLFQKSSSKKSSSTPSSSISESITKKVMESLPEWCYKDDIGTSSICHRKRLSTWTNQANSSKKSVKLLEKALPICIWSGIRRTLQSQSGHNVMMQGCGARAICNKYNKIFGLDGIIVQQLKPFTIQKAIIEKRLGSLHWSRVVQWKCHHNSQLHQQTIPQWCKMHSKMVRHLKERWFHL